MEASIQPLANSAPDVDFNFAVARRQSQIGIGTGKRTPPETAVFEGAVQPPKTGLGVQPLDDPEPIRG